MFDFDQQIDRGAAYSTKWNNARADSGTDGLLPFWIADMDFVAPPFIQQAIQTRLDHGVHGYTDTPPELTERVIDWLRQHCHNRVATDEVRWLPGVVPALNLAAKACAEPGGAIAVPTPVYHPFLTVPRNAGQTLMSMPLVRENERWVMDFEQMAAIADAPGVKGKITSLLLSNPQNPTGRSYALEELAALAEFCLARGITIISDEIHSPLIIDTTLTHRSIAGLSSEVAQHCITLHAATKAYNVAGLNAAVAIINDPALRQRFDDVERGLVSAISPFAYAVAAAAYTDSSSYLSELRAYLADNHQRLFSAVNAVPGVHMTPVEATYLGWLDIRATGIEKPEAHLLKHGLRLSPGQDFGAPGFMRFNFAAPRATVDEGIRRLVRALRDAP